MPQILNDNIFIITLYYVCSVNLEKLDILSSERLPYLFSSEDLSKLVEVTESVKTKIQIISIIGPRLTDPRAKTEYFVGLFRFSEEKSTVEEVLKARTVTMNAAIFTKVNNLSNSGGRGGGRLGGRNGSSGGRGVTTHNRGGSDVANLDRIIEDEPFKCESAKLPVVDRRSNLRRSFSKSQSDLANMDVEISMRHTITDISESPSSVADINPPLAIAARAPVARNPVTTTYRKSVAENKLVDMSQSRVKSISREKLSDAAVDAAKAPDAATIARLNRKSNPGTLADLLEQDSKQVEVAAAVMTTASHVKTNKGSWIKKDDPPPIPVVINSSPDIKKSSDVQRLKASFNNTSNNNMNNKSLSKHLSMSLTSSTSRIASPASDDSTYSANSTSSYMNSRRYSEISNRSLYNINSSAAVLTSVSNDVANKCAAVLKMDKSTFLSLSPEEAIKTDSNGNQFFSFTELVRRNYTKEYIGLLQSDLEKYLTDEEFLIVFEKNKVIVILLI